MNEDALKFLNALGAHLTPDERLILCMVQGDPGLAAATAWKPRPWHPQVPLRHRFPTAWNGYVTVGAFNKSADGSFRRRTANCTGGFALMIDDVGTKVSREAVAGVPPSARVETSPGNEQWWYIFGEPERDPVRFDALIRAFIAGKLLGKDPGMAGVTRVGRLPGFQNCKPEYGGWEVKLLELNDKRFSVEELLTEFDLKLNGRAEHLAQDAPKRRPADIEERLYAYSFVEVMLERSGMFKSAGYDPSGWRDVHCPWVGEHTGGVDNGAAVREPHPENGYYGAFRCHHGSHQGHGWRELTDWVAEEAVDALELGAEAAERDFEEQLARGQKDE